MRKLKLQMQISIDGYAAGLNNELDWIEWNWDDELKNYVTELTETVDCIILGRKLAENFIDTWASWANDPDKVVEGAEKINSIPKVVFSRTLENVKWKNTKLANGNLTDEIISLKNEPGKDIMVYGGAGFVSSLIEQELIDEFHLFVNPSAISNGMPIFKSRKKLKLVKSRSFKCGIVLLNYEPVK